MLSHVRHSCFALAPSLRYILAQLLKSNFHNHIKYLLSYFVTFTIIIEKINYVNLSSWATKAQSVKNAPRRGPSASEPRFLTFTEGATRLHRRRPFPPGGGPPLPFRSKTHAKIDREIDAENHGQKSQNELQNGVKIM